MIGGGNLHVLDVILGHGEHQQVSGQGQSGVTAAEVHNLEDLIDAGAFVGGDGTVTIDVTPSIQIAVDLDVRAGGHIDIAQSVGGGGIHTAGTAGSSVTAAHFQRTVNGDGGLGIQGQGAIGIGLHPFDGVSVGAGAGGHVAMGSMGIVIRDQQSDALGNHVIAGDGAVVQQNNHLVGVAGGSGGSGVAQIVVLGSANAEQSHVIGNKHGSDLGIRRSHQLEAGVLRQILVGVGVVPAVEDVTILSSGRQLQLGADGNLFGHLGGDRVAVQGVGTTLGSGLEGQNGIRLIQADQSQIGDGEGSRVSSTTGGFQSDGNALAVGQSLGELAGGAGLAADGDGAGQRGTGGGGGTAGGQRPIKAEHRFGARIIGQGQVGDVGLSSSTFRCSRNGGTTGGPGGGAAALVGVLPGRGQTGHGSVEVVRREYGGDHRRKHCQSQQYCADALDPLFHGSRFLSL